MTVATLAPQLPTAPAVDVVEVATKLRAIQDQLLPTLNTLRGYLRGELGRPYVPPGSSPEIRRLRDNAVKNIIKLVVDSYAENLAATGFRSGDSNNDLPPWKLWQANRLDALQSVVHRASSTYGVAYVTVLPGKPVPVIRPASPRRMVAVYADTMCDQWPMYAWESWTQWTPGGTVTLGRLYDDENVYDFTLPVNSTQLTLRATSAHDAGVCPVVRFVNDLDTEGEVVGDVEPLLPLQRAINVTEFNQAVIEQFGAFPQRVVIGWKPENEAEALTASIKKLWTFKDPDVKTDQFPAAALQPYIDRQQSTMQHAAMIAQVPPQQLVGDMTNLSADALAAAEAAQQRRLGSKRESLGESWEQVLRLAAALNGDDAGAVDDSAEIIWKDTETRSFAAVADGIAKLARAGVPVEELVEDIPGMTQQRIARMVAAIQKAAAAVDNQALLTSLATAHSGPTQVGTSKPPVDPNAPVGPVAPNDTGAIGLEGQKLAPKPAVPG